MIEKKNDRDQTRERVTNHAWDRAIKREIEKNLITCISSSGRAWSATKASDWLSEWASIEQTRSREKKSVKSRCRHRQSVSDLNLLRSSFQRASFWSPRKRGIRWVRIARARVKRNSPRNPQPPVFNFWSSLTREKPSPSTWAQRRSIGDGCGNSLRWTASEVEIFPWGITDVYGDRSRLGIRDLSPSGRVFEMSFERWVGREKTRSARGRSPVHELERWHEDDPRRSARKMPPLTSWKG